MMLTESHGIAIRVSGLRKVFRIYRKPMDIVMDLVFGKAVNEPFVALDGVDFEIKKGEVVGIVGRNGAGKSTLLKILAGTLDHTSGSVEVSGKVSAILELGSGFQPDKTGRENIYLGGMCLGMSREEVAGKEESIIQFSELGDFIDQDFRTYSSGMQARLTFAVASHVDAEVLIIDEALAAGDAVFVNKCLRRIGELCNGGKTVFFVSHSVDMIRRLCDRAIWMEQGKIRADGDVVEVLSDYTGECLRTSFEHRIKDELGARIASDGRIQFDKCILETEHGSVLECETGGRMSISVSLFGNEEMQDVGVWLSFFRHDGVNVTSWFSLESDISDNIAIHEGRNTLRFIADNLRLGDGEYDMVFGVFERRDKKLTVIYDDPILLIEPALRFRVRRRGRALNTVFDQEFRIVLQ